MSDETDTGTCDGCGEETRNVDLTMIQASTWPLLYCPRCIDDIADMP